MKNNTIKDLSIQAIKNINKIEGFDTDTLANTIMVNNDGHAEEKQILLLPYKKAWARMKFPHYKMIYAEKEILNGSAHVIARFYEDKNDDENAYIGEGEAFVLIDPSDERPLDILSNEALLMAKGSAASRAFTDAGFGLQYYIDEAEENKGTEPQKNDPVAKPVLNDIPDDIQTAIPIPLNKDTQEGTLAQMDLPGLESDFPLDEISGIDMESDEPYTPPTKDSATKAKKKSIEWSLDSAKTLIADCGNLRGRELGDLSAEELFWLYSQPTDATIRQGCLVMAKCNTDIRQYFTAKGVPV